MMFIISVIIGVFISWGIIFMIDIAILFCWVSRKTRRTLLGFKDGSNDGVVTWYYKGEDAVTKGPFDTFTMQQMYLEGEFADVMVRQGLGGEWEQIANHFQDLGHNAKIWNIEGGNGGPYSNEQMREYMDDAVIDTSTQIQLSNQVGRYAAVGQFFPDHSTAFLCAPRQPGMKALQNRQTCVEPVHQNGNRETCQVGAEEFFDMQALSVKSGHGQIKSTTTGKNVGGAKSVKWAAHQKSMAPAASSCDDGTQDIITKTTTRYERESAIMTVGAEDSMAPQAEDIPTGQDNSQHNMSVDPVTGKKQTLAAASSKFGMTPKQKLEQKPDKQVEAHANQFGWSAFGSVPKK